MTISIYFLLSVKLKIRVQKAACPIQNYFVLLSRTCYPEYKESYEDTSIINEEYKDKDPYAG